MRKLMIVLFLALTPLFSISAQTNPLQEKVEQYLAEKASPKEFQLLEFGEVLPFDYEQIVEKYREPEIFKDEEWAHEENRKVFGWLEKFQTKRTLTHYVNFICGSKEPDGDTWVPHWGIALINGDEVVCGFHYAP